MQKKTEVRTEIVGALINCFISWARPIDLGDHQLLTASITSQPAFLLRSPRWPIRHRSSTKISVVLKPLAMVYAGRWPMEACLAWIKQGRWRRPPSGCEKIFTDSLTLIVQLVLITSLIITGTMPILRLLILSIFPHCTYMEYARSSSTVQGLH